MKTKPANVKIKPLFMVRDEPGDTEHLAFYNLTGLHSKRPATAADETLEGMAEMLDSAAENCNAHDLAELHARLAVLLSQECSPTVAVAVMRRIVNYEGLHGLNGICGKGSASAVKRELGIGE